MIGQIFDSPSRRIAEDQNYLVMGMRTDSGSVHLPSQECRNVVLVIFLLPGAQL
jgi:hypothetical protein